MLKLYDKPFISPEGYDLYDNAQTYKLGPKALADKVARNYYDNPDKYKIKDFYDWWEYAIRNLPFELPSQDDDEDEWLNELYGNDDNIQYLKYLYTSGPYQDSPDSALKRAYGTNILDSEGNDVTAESYDDYYDYDAAIDRYYARHEDVNGDGDSDVVFEDYDGDGDGDYDYAEINADDIEELKGAGKKVNDAINKDNDITSTGKTKKELSEDDVDNSNIINALKDLRF